MAMRNRTPSYRQLVSKRGQRYTWTYGPGYATRPRPYRRRRTWGRWSAEIVLVAFLLIVVVWVVLSQTELRKMFGW
jgi:hypothetical protein